MNNWYDIVDSTKNITQGDILLNCPLLIPNYPSEELTTEDIEKLNKPDAVIDTDVFFHNIIILNQACDLEVREGKDKPKLSMVMVAPLQDARLSNMGKGSLQKIAKLDRTELFLLEPSYENIKMGYQVINFDTVLTIPWKLLNAFSKLQEHRLRIKSPYTEHLSQHLANHFGRVGVPENRGDSVAEFYRFRDSYESRRITGEFHKPWEHLNDEEVFAFIEANRLE